MSLTKQQLQVLNTTNFPNNTTGYITPALLREFNSESVDSMALQTDLDTFSSSVSTQLVNLNNFSSSLVTNFATVAQLNASSSTLQAEINTLAGTASVNTLSQSIFVQFDAQAQTNANVTLRFDADELEFNQYTASNDIAVAGKAVLVGNNTFSGSQLITGNVTILGNIAAANFTQSWTSSLVSQTQFGAYTASISTSLWQLYTSASVNSSSIGSLQTASASFDSRLDSLEAWSTSLDLTYATDAQLNASSSALTANLNASSSTLQANIDTKLNTSSFNTFSTSVDSRLDSLEGAGFVSASITASSVITASFNTSSRNLTFTKGDSSQFSVNIPDVSGSIINTGSLLVTASAAGNTITFTKGDASTFDVTVAGGSGSSAVGYLTTGSTLTDTQYISGALEFTGSARIKILTASFANVGTGQPQISVKYDPSASALSYLEVNTNLPQYINQAVKVGMIATGSLVGGLVKVYADPNQTGSNAGGTTNQGGLLYASQSTTDWRYVFGYNGNPQNNGEGAFVVQRGLHKLAGNATSIQPGDLALYPIGSPVYWSGQAQGACTLTRPTNGIVLRLGYIAAIENEANPYVREIWYDPVWEEGETLYNLRLSGSVTLINSNLVTTSSLGTYATTGSNTFTGNQVINGTLQISSSATFDLDVTGGIKATTQLQVSSSVGISAVAPGAVSYTSGGLSSALTRGLVQVNSGSAALGQIVNQIGLYAGPAFGTFTSGMAGGGLAVNSGSTPNTWYYPIQFQGAGAYTDGRVTFATPISASAGFTGSVTIKGDEILSGSLTIASSSVNDFYIYGHKQFNVGGFQTNVSKSGSAGVSQSIDFEITDLSYGVTMVSGSQLTFVNAGLYNIQFSAQIETNAGADTAWIWFKKNGTNIAESATKVVLANNTAQVMAVNFLVDAAANDYVQLAWQNNSGNAVLLAENASGNIPAIPSVIITATQVR